MSRKSVPFAVPDGSARPEGSSGRRPAPGVIDAHTDEWVSDRHSSARDFSARPDLVLDLAAERGLAEVAALSMLIPIALGGFWLLRAMAGRLRP